jgi:hypothetical protein
MHILVEIGDDSKNALAAFQGSMEALKADLLTLSTEEQLFLAGTDLFESANSSRRVLVLSEGAADLRLGGFSFASFEVGDVIAPSFMPTGASLSCGFAVRAHVIPWSSCEPKLKADHAFFQKWFSFVHAEKALFSCLTAEFLVRSVGESSGEYAMPLMVGAQDVIIKQGDLSNEVFTLLEGSLDVLVDGVKVGQIERDEIFGVISALSDTPRSASVVAATDSMVLKLPKGEFIQLMRARPDTVLDLVRSMARALVSSNVKVVSLTNRLAL